MVMRSRYVRVRVSLWIRLSGDEAKRYPAIFGMFYLAFQIVSFARSTALAEVCDLLSAILVSIEVSRMETSLSKPDSLTLRRI